MRSARSVRFSLLAALVPVCAFGLGSLACSSDGGDAEGAGGGAKAGAPAGAGAAAAMPQAVPAGKAQIRVIHASPDAPKVDVWVEGQSKPVITNLGFGETSPLLTVDPGKMNFLLRAAGGTVVDPIVYATGPTEIPMGARISAVAAGLLSKSGADEKFRVLPVVESFKPAGAGKVAIRVLHASPDAPTVGLDVGNDDPTKPEVFALPRFSDTGADGLPLPANAPLAIGIASSGKKVTAFTTPALPEGGEVLVIATGLLAKAPRDGMGFGLLAVGPGGTLGFIRQDPTIYALHASPDAPAVDIFAGQNELIAGLSFGELSAPLQVAPGSYDLDFFPASHSIVRPAGEPAAKKATGNLAAGERYLVLASGFLAPKTAHEKPFQLIAAPERIDASTQANAAVLHASPDAPKVDIGVATTGTITPVLVPGLEFGSITPSKELSPGTTLLGVAPAGTPSPVARFSVPLAHGGRGFVVAAGGLGRGAAFRLVYVDVNAHPWTATSIASTH